MDLKGIDLTSGVKRVVDKCLSWERLSEEDAVLLYREAPLFLLSQLALRVKRAISGNEIYYNKNFHIEPTNICTYNCKFCSYRKRASDKEAWDMSMEEISRYIDEHGNDAVTEVHLVGGVNPSHTLERYGQIIGMVKKKLPHVAVKGFSAIEHIYMIEKAGLGYKEGLKRLMECGMDTITGGGAEISCDKIRSRICPDKPGTDKWLALHRAAHELGMKTNATMLYGHIEQIEDRVDHLAKLRALQDETDGFNAFIPLKYRNKNNSMSYLSECSIIEDLKTLAISRLFWDNVPHIKAYWPMYGKQITELALLFGADDIDGTVQDTTRIYTMAGVNDRAMDEEELRRMVVSAGFVPVERDTFYRKVGR